MANVVMKSERVSHEIRVSKVIPIFFSTGSQRERVHICVGLRKRGTGARQLQLRRLHQLHMDPVHIVGYGTWRGSMVL